MRSIAWFPLAALPLFAPAGAMIPVTDTGKSARLHDEPSRRLLVFPSLGSGKAQFTLYEDDGISRRYRDGEYAEVAFELDTTPADIALTARVEGRYALPYREIAVELPAGERRKLSLRGEGVMLVSKR